jgi:hypothetical protein
MKGEHDMEKESTATVECKPVDHEIAVPCVICGTFVSLNERERCNLLIGHVNTKVCKECKAAVAFAKKMMQSNG